MLGDKAYDSAELREELDELGTKPVQVLSTDDQTSQPVPYESTAIFLRLRNRSILASIDLNRVLQLNIWRSLCLSRGAEMMKAKLTIIALASAFAPLQYVGACKHCPSQTERQLSLA